jgi:hypothetical protein
MKTKIIGKGCVKVLIIQRMVKKIILASNIYLLDTRHNKHWDKSRDKLENPIARIFSTLKLPHVADIFNDLKC